MLRVAGVDGCKAGWIIATGDLSNGKIRNVSLGLAAKFAEVMAIRPKVDKIVVDIPIGLLDEQRKGGRNCDQMARKILGAPRASSVFSPPIRPMLQARSYDEVRARGLTIQAWHILPKIREVDECMTPPTQRQVLEGHPELAFFGIFGQPTRFNKKKKKGWEERLDLLAEATGPEFEAPVEELFNTHRNCYLRKDVGSDDILDAYVLLWLAARARLGRAERLPECPARDSSGLRMEIWWPGR